MGTLADVITEVASHLAFVAPTSTGLKELPAHAVPPRYVWVPRAIITVGGQSIGGSPKSYGDDLKVSDVHCWAADLAGAERLRLGLVTALHVALKGVNYVIQGTSYEERGFMSDGYLVVVTVQIRMPLVRQRIPTAVGVPMVDDTATRATIATVAIDNTQAVLGDGVLTGNEG